MNPLFQWVIAHSVMKSLARECPRCKHVQIVAKSQATLPVPCKKCGTAIPAPRA